MRTVLNLRSDSHSRIDHSIFVVPNNDYAQQLSLSPGVYLLFSPASGVALRWSFSEWMYGLRTGFVMAPELEDGDKFFMVPFGPIEQLPVMTPQLAEAYRRTQTLRMDQYRTMLKIPPSRRIDFYQLGRAEASLPEPKAVRHALTIREFVRAAYGIQLANSQNDLYMAEEYEQQVRNLINDYPQYFSMLNSTVMVSPHIIGLARSLDENTALKFGAVRR